MGLIRLFAAQPWKAETSKAAHQKLKAPEPKLEPRAKMATHETLQAEPARQNSRGFRWREMVYSGTYNDSSLCGAGWEAAVDGCLQPACVSQELVQSGRVTSSTELCGCRKLEQRSREGSLRGNGEDATPTVHPSRLSSAAQSGQAPGPCRLAAPQT